LTCGCQFGTAVRPAGGPGDEVRVVVPADYHVVYARIVTSAKAQRLRDHVVAGGSEVRSSIDEAERTARVSMWSSYGTAHHHVVAHVQELEPGRTQVRVTYPLSSWKGAAERVAQWAQGP
jgi:hypothetical protein